MSPEQQRIAIAEACGWTNIQQLDEVYPGGYVAEAIWWQGEPPEGSPLAGEQLIPDYVDDLNAMHEAEQFAWGMDWKLRAIFVDHLARALNPVHGYRMQSGVDLLDATAAQRAEAFLRTIGKWEDDK
jgi:hypothetical protein